MTEWPLTSQLKLAALPNAPRWARRHTQDVLSKWAISVTDEVEESALMVVSELVTNASKVSKELSPTNQARYVAQPMSVQYVDLASLGYLHLRLSSDHHRLLIEVWDKSNEPPVAKIPDFESVNGRGLFLVSAYSDRWNWYPTRGGGKWVWAEFAL